MVNLAGRLRPSTRASMAMNTGRRVPNDGVAPPKVPSPTAALSAEAPSAQPVTASRLSTNQYMQFGLRRLGFRALAVSALLLAGVGCTETDTQPPLANENIAETRQRLWSLPTKVQVGYWHNFKNPAGCPIPLRDVAQRAPYWDVINIAFAERDPAGDGYVAFHVFNNPMGEGCSLSGLSEQDFKDDVAYLQGLGKVVSLSLGGAEGTITLSSSTHEDNFVSSLTAIINEFGFDGLDVDYESGSGISHEGAIIKNKHLSNALKRINTNLGGSMYLSMAPEHPYVQGGAVAYSGIWGSYLPLIDDLRNELDLLHVQLYNNSSVPNPWGIFPVNSVDNLVASAKMLIEGFQPSGGPTFTGLPASKIAFGVPSGPKSSNPPFISTSTIEDAYDCVTSNTNCQTLSMANSQPGFRGVMSWSINWDEYDKSNNTPGRIDFAQLETHMGGGSCTPNCSGRACGDNGCGGSCGTCSTGQSCTGSGQCVSSCTPKTCVQLGATCGAPSDGCGGVLSCGTCSAPYECSSSYTCQSAMKGHFKLDSLWNGTTVIDETNTSGFSQTVSSKQPAVVSGKIGSAMRFDGVDDELSSDSPSAIHTALAGGGGVSIAAWLKSDGPKADCTGTSCQQHVFYSYTTDASGGFGMRLTENYELACGARPATGATNPFAEAKVKYTWEGQWIHAVCAFDAANDKIRIYVNGEEVTNSTVSWASTTFTNASSSNMDLIGGGPGNTGSTNCNAAPWNPSVAYNGAQTASRNGYDYTAAYWTQGDDPALTENCCGGGKPWLSKVACSGSGTSSGGFFKGSIDQLKLFNKALLQSEVVTLFEEGGGVTCTPLTCQTGDCGAKPDGCGGVLSCGTCGTGQTCDDSYQCVSSCTPLSCQSGDCGAKPDGCGGTLSCGTCTTGESCNASNRCEATCVPASCPAGACGTMSDGCSGTLNCGGCDTGYTCNSSNQCDSSGTGGGCSETQGWSMTEPWTNYTTTSQRKHNGRRWRCHTPGWCYLEPGGGNSSLGWTDQGGC